MRELIWSDEVGEAMVELADGFFHLLAQEMKGGKDLCSGFVSVEFDIVANGVGGEEAIDRSHGERFLLDDAAQELLGILEELVGFGVLQNGRVAATEFPRVEERGPVYERDKILQRNR